jgi:hypothetical protein
LGSVRNQRGAQAPLLPCLWAEHSPTLLETSCKIIHLRGKVCAHICWCNSILFSFQYNVLISYHLLVNHFECSEYQKIYLWLSNGVLISSW